MVIQMPEPAKAPAPATMQEERLAAPKVDGFKVFGKRLAEPAEIIDALSTLSFLEIAQEADYVAVLNVESRDIRRSPYLFSTIYLKPDVVEVAYTLVPGTSPRKRRIDVLRHFLNILSVIPAAYEVDHRGLYQLLQSALADITEFASSDYKEVFARYDALRKDYDDVKRRADALEASNTKVSKDLIDAKARNDDITLRLGQLEAYTDEALMVKIQDWLDVHRNEINVSEFAKQYSVVDSRVEDVLNKMMLRGYLELRG